MSLTDRNGHKLHAVRACATRLKNLEDSARKALAGMLVERVASAVNVLAV